MLYLFNSYLESTRLLSLSHIPFGIVFFQERWLVVLFTPIYMHYIHLLFYLFHFMPSFGGDSLYSHGNQKLFFLFKLNASNLSVNHAYLYKLYQLGIF